MRKPKSGVLVAIAIATGLMGTTLSLGAEARDERRLELKVHHITAVVVDLDRAVNWYQQVLGLRLREQGAREPGPVRFAELSMPAFGVGLVQLPPAVAAARPAGPLAPTWLHIVFSVKDLKGTRALLEQRGAMVRTRERDGRLEALLVDDSEGNEIEILPEAAGS